MWTDMDANLPPAPGEENLPPAPTVTRASPDQAGVWVDEVHGIYAPVGMADVALAFGWQPNDLDAAIIEWARHPERALSDALAAVDIDSLPEFWAELQGDIEQWLNDHVAPDGHSFGWHDGSFHLASATWWCEGSGPCDDPEHDHTAPDW